MPMQTQCSKRGKHEERLHSRSSRVAWGGVVVFLSECMMNQQSLTKDRTGWIPLEINPVRRGVYEVQSISAGAIHYSLWDGRKWCISCATPDLAARQTEFSFGVYEEPYYARWRGLLADQI